MTASDVTDYTQRSETYALFGELGRTFSEKVEATLGLRLDYTTRELHRTHDSTFGSPPPVNADAGFFNAAPKLTLAYHFNDAILAYGSTGLGFKPGGLSAFVDPPGSPKFGTETAWASELGLKSTWLGGKVTANASLFYNDVTDYQVELFTPGGIDITVANAPSARTLGAELELSLKPWAGVELSAFGGYTDARLNNFTDPFTGVTVHDARPPYVPQYNAGISAQYRHRSGLIVRIGFTAVGETVFDPVNSALNQSAYGLLSARFGYEREHFGIFLFGENLTDTEYFTKKVSSLNAGAPGQPQIFGIEATARY